MVVMQIQAEFSFHFTKINTKRSAAQTLPLTLTCMGFFGGLLCAWVGMGLKLPPSLKLLRIRL